jgi:CPA2 family monovalent cation:H+ antiporter-2
LVDPLDAWLFRQPRLSHWFRKGKFSTTSVAADNEPSDRFRAVVVGYGPVGRTLSRLLRDNEITPTIIELNVETVRQLRAEGVPAIYGDASHRDTLEAAGVAEATSLLLSSSGLANAQEIIRLARELNPTIRVLVRCSYLRETAAISEAGADRIFSGEGEVALAMTESVLRKLGATAEQIDRERDRVRADLFGGLVPRRPSEPSVDGDGERKDESDEDESGSSANSAGGSE